MWQCGVPARARVCVYVHGVLTRHKTRNFSLQVPPAYFTSTSNGSRTSSGAEGNSSLSGFLGREGRLAIRFLIVSLRIDEMSSSLGVPITSKMTSSWSMRSLGLSTGWRASGVHGERWEQYVPGKRGARSDFRPLFFPLVAGEEPVLVSLPSPPAFSPTPPPPPAPPARSLLSPPSSLSSLRKLDCLCDRCPSLSPPSPSS